MFKHTFFMQHGYMKSPGDRKVVVTPKFLPPIFSSNWLIFYIVCGRKHTNRIEILTIPARAVFFRTTPLELATPVKRKLLIFFNKPALVTRCPITFAHSWCMPLDSAAKAGAPRTFQALALVKVRRVRRKVEASLAPLAEFNRYPLLFFPSKAINILRKISPLTICWN